jgi:hypothetical protein
MALSFVLSWYDEVRLDQLPTHRAGIQAMSDAGVNELRVRTATIAGYVDIKKFVPPIGGEDGRPNNGNGGHRDGSGDDDDGDDDGNGDDEDGDKSSFPEL